MALTPEEQKELAELEARLGQSQPRGLTPEEAAELASLEAQLGGQPQEQGFMSKALSGLASGLDYAGGIVRAGAANIADVAVPGEIATKEDLLNALKGNAPGTAEYMKRAGVPEGYSLSDALGGSLYSETGDEYLKFQKGGPLDPTARGAVGFVGDVALDPLTYLSLGSSAAAKQAAKTGAKLTGVQKAKRAATTPIEALSEYTGKKTYKSGLKRIDQEAAKFGKEPVSDVLMKYGITGSADDIYKQMDTLADNLKFEKDKILVEAQNKGATVSMKEAMGPAQARINAMKATNDPKLLPIAESLQSEVNKYLKLDPRPAYTEVGFTPSKVVQGELPVQGVTRPAYTEVGFAPRSSVGGDLMATPGKTFEESFVQAQPVPYAYKEPARAVPGKTFEEIMPVDIGRADTFKTSIYKDIPKGAYQESLSTKPKAFIEGEKEMARGLKESVEKATGMRASELARINDELGRILTTGDKQQLEAFKEANKNLFTSVDALAVAHSPWTLMYKKAADIAKMTGPRTKTGKALTDFGRGSTKGLSDIAARRSFWELMNQEPNNYVERDQ